MRFWDCCRLLFIVCDWAKFVAATNQSWDLIKSHGHLQPFLRALESSLDLGMISICSGCEKNPAECEYEQTCWAWKHLWLCTKNMCRSASWCYCRHLTCFQAVTIIPIPGKSAVSCLNEYCTVAITSIRMSCFDWHPSQPGPSSLCIYKQSIRRGSNSRCPQIYSPALWK